ncbi:MAG: dienelactone hydrolase family protein [Planctomycetes bacterium]|jgi:carboxymethylenebutenolidase|nr:dienelactone hydrolase family protein [Planctomycetota bacterium]
MRSLLVSLSLTLSLLAQDPTPPKPMHGELDEKAFAALHDLKQEAPPALTGTMVKIGKQKHYLALPKQPKAPLPAIVIIHEWWGLNDHIKHWADRMAEQGYAALAVDLYGGTVAKKPEEAQAAMKQVDQAAAVATLRAAFDFLGTDPRVLANKRACLGWCFGGAMSLQLAIAEPKLDACVLYYGRLVEDKTELAKVQAPVLAVFGTRDRSIPDAKVTAFETAMTELKKDVKVLRYDAEHAFANPSGARYDQKNAAAAWAEVKAFLQRKLTAPATK